jgi:beta-glucanase (GH16 family)
MKLRNTVVLFVLMMINQFTYAQVDVIYNDLVWSDEFNTNGALNSSNWHHQTQIPAGGSWYNGEVQHYTNRISNSFVENGVLKIVAIKQAFTDQGVTKQYTSARLNSKFAFTYGRVDIRAKVPTNKGTWPALWLLGKNISEPGSFFEATHGTTPWPACGEIDIMEHGITQSKPQGYIQSAIHTPSSFGNTINHGGKVANDLGTSFHVYSMNWSPNKIVFLLDGVEFYTYNPSEKNSATWPFTADQFLLLNIAMGGVAGDIPSQFTQATMEIDYVRVYQNVTPDNQAPTNFTATLGDVTTSTVQLLVNAKDNIGSVNYNVSYGSQNVQVAELSGIQKSIVIPNLTPNTSYTFSITASDASGNMAANNPIVINAKTPDFIGCTATSTLAQQGNFTSGYSYSFETVGNDVKITYTLLDTDKTGVVAYLWRQSPFTEYPMTEIGNNTFTYTITGQTIGANISYGVKFAFAGGLSVTNYYTYQVGKNCIVGLENVSLVPDFYFQNPSNGILEIQSENSITKVEIYDIGGRLVLETRQMNQPILLSHLSKGIYLVRAYYGEKTHTKKMILE